MNEYMISSCDLFCVATGKSKRDLDRKYSIQFQGIGGKYDSTKTHHVSCFATFLMIILYPLSDDSQKRTLNPSSLICAQVCWRWLSSVKPVSGWCVEQKRSKSKLLLPSKRSGQVINSDIRQSSGQKGVVGF